MNHSLKLVIERILFGPSIFLFVLVILVLWPLKNKQRDDHPKYQWLLILWVLVLVLTSTPFFRLFSYPLRQLIPPNQKAKVDAIVVASAGVHRSGAPTPGSTLRGYVAAQLYLEHWAPLVIVTGGVTRPYHPPVDVKGIHLILRGMGVPNDKILIENKSINTYMNGVETAKILRKLNLNKILLVSHDYHLPRLVAVFKKQGFEIYPYAANASSSNDESWWEYYFKWENFNSLKTVAHEYMGLLAYKLVGRI
ncbi:YdcF family protein [Deltaproteobacteria bacterium TL4]